MYCDLGSAYSGFRPVQLTETEAEPTPQMMAQAVPHPPPSSLGTQPQILPQAVTVPLQAQDSAEISDRRLLVLLTGLVVVLLFVLLVLVVQLSQAQTALLRALAWR